MRQALSLSLVSGTSFLVDRSSHRPTSHRQTARPLADTDSPAGRRMKTSGLGNITIRKRPEKLKAMTTSVGDVKCRQVPAPSFAPEPMGSPSQAIGMNCPYAGHAGPGAGPALGGFLACWRARERNTSKAARKLSLVPHPSAPSPNPVAGFHMPSSHPRSSPISPPRGPRLGQVQ